MVGTIMNLIDKIGLGIAVVLVVIICGGLALSLGRVAAFYLSTGGV